MADSVEKCGSTTITYPSGCAYWCICNASGCWWTVKCNGTVFTGEGLTTPKPPKHPHVTVAGNLAAIAEILEKRLKRSVVVPAKLKGRRIRRRRIRGTAEQVAEALGLQLGPRRRA